KASNMVPCASFPAARKRGGGADSPLLNNNNNNSGTSAAAAVADFLDPAVVKAIFAFAAQGLPEGRLKLVHFATALVHLSLLVHDDYVERYQEDLARERAILLAAA